MAGAVPTLAHIRARAADCLGKRLRKYTIEARNARSHGFKLSRCLCRHAQAIETCGVPSEVCAVSSPTSGLSPNAALTRA